MNFLTVEDVNTVSLNHINEYYELNTGNISEQDFNSVLYDFIIVSHSISNDTHVFTFEINNSLWTGGYYFKKANGTYISAEGSYDAQNNTLTFTTTESSLILVLYLCSFAPSFNLVRLTQRLTSNNIIYITKNQESDDITIPYNVLTNNSQSGATVNLSPGLKTINNQIFVLVSLKKTDLIFDLNNTELTVGIVNHVRLNIDNEYLPNGTLVDEDSLEIQIIYEDNVISAYYDEDLNDYCFDLDLTDKNNAKPIKIKLVVNEIDLVNPGLFEYTLFCKYTSANSFNELQSILFGTSEIIELTGDINFTSNLVITHDLLIIGSNKNLNLNSYSFIISDNITVKFLNCNFNQGNPCIIQNNNTKIVLNSCKFTNASINDNYKGSVLSSEYGEDIIGEITNCTFINCHHTIYYSGDLTINKCKALFNAWNNNVDSDYSAFLTIYDGVVEITNSIFDIDYNTDTLCNNQIDIKFAESLISLGENTIFNGVTTNLLNSNDSLPFFERPFNNLSHLYVRYFYPQINSSVISSPLLNNEDKSVCHSILGVDWVYKNNVQITRVDWNSQNEIRKIDWGEI